MFAFEGSAQSELAVRVTACDVHVHARVGAVSTSTTVQVRGAAGGATLWSANRLRVAGDRCDRWPESSCACSVTVHVAAGAQLRIEQDAADRSFPLVSVADGVEL